MNRQKYQTKVSPKSICNETTATTTSDYISDRQRMIEKYLIMCVHSDINEPSEDHQQLFVELKNIYCDICIFPDWNEAIDFITDLEDIKVFLILTADVSQQILNIINDMSQIDTIYPLCNNNSHYKEWTMKSNKITSVYENIESLSQALQLTIKYYNQASISMSFIPVNEMNSVEKLNQLEPLFMYTQIFKEILLEMKHDRKSMDVFIAFWRQHYRDNISILRTIAEFEHSYSSQSSIWWYSREYFIYQTLNQALRTLDSDTIINMGFFIHDLHKQIQQLHQKQANNYGKEILTVYRGQGLSKVDFDKLLKSKGGLMSFNNFLSTSKARDISLGFAMGAMTNTDTIGILFRMTIDLSISSTPFASISDISYYKTEEEILFSMHTVFRIDEITKINNNEALYQVDLILTSDDDEELRTLTNRIREEVAGATGWERLGALLVKIGQLNKAEELFNVLLEETFDQSNKALYSNQLGYIKNHQGDHEKAIEYFEKSLEIWQKTLSPNHPHLATSYDNIGEVHKNMGEYSQALSFYNKSLAIRQRTLPPNHPDLAASYNNIAAVYKDTGEYLKALPFYNKSLEIFEKTLPPNHPSLATSYNNIAAVYRDMGEYSQALSFYNKSLEIDQRTLPPNHPDLAASYNNIGEVYQNMGEYSKALSFYNRSHEIFEKTLPPNHPSLATSYNNIAGVYRDMGEYSKALSFYNKSLEIYEKALPLNHPSLATSYNNIAAVYDNMGEYSKALSFYNKSLEIDQKTLCPNQPSLATSYNNIAGVYDNMGEYSQALSFYNKSLDIRQKILPSNHPDFAQSYNNIAGVYQNMGEYSKALSFYNKSLEIHQKTLPPNHPSLATLYNNIAMVYDDMREYSKALSFYNKSLEIYQETLPLNHDLLATSYNNIGMVYVGMGEYSKALSYLERAMNIWKSSLPPNHPNIQTIQRNIELLRRRLQTSSE